MPNQVNVLAMLEAAMANAKPDPAFVKKYGPPVALTIEQAMPIVSEIERAAAADAAALLSEDMTSGVTGGGENTRPLPGPVLGKEKDKSGKDNKTGGKTHS